MSRSRAARILIGLGFFSTIAVALYWLAWFAAPDLVQSRSPGAPDYGIYVAFEQAFPLGDTWLALASLLGALGLIRRRPWGFLFMLLAGSAAVFLGLMDLLYDLEHGMFVPFTAEATIELAIVVLLLALGPTVILITWIRRDELNA